MQGSARVALISDIHGNTPALQAVLGAIESAGIRTVYVLGDVINAVDPGGCCDLLRARENTFVIKGNAEEYVCTDNLEGFPLKDDPGWQWVLPRMRWIRDQIGTDHLAWIRSWPEELVRGDALIVHDSPVDRSEADQGPADLPPEYRRLYNHGAGLGVDAPDTFLRANHTILKERGITTLFCGHTHEPFVTEFEGVTICNAGSVGMPLDGDPRACWASWSPEGIDIHRLEYDLESAVALMERKEHDTGARTVDRYVNMLRHAKHWRFFE